MAHFNESGIQAAAVSSLLSFKRCAGDKAQYVQRKTLSQVPMEKLWESRELPLFMGCYMEKSA